MRNDGLNDYAGRATVEGNSALAIEAFRQAQARESQKFQAAMNQKAQDVYSKPDPEQPLVRQAIERLSCISGKLSGAHSRIATVAERVLGSWPVSGETKADGSVSGSADELLGLIDLLARQVEDLHDVASRVERIG